MRQAHSGLRLGRRRIWSASIGVLALTLPVALLTSAVPAAARTVARRGRESSLTPASYESTVLADNPLVYWRLGESSGTTASDSSGHGVTGQYQAGVTLSAPAALVGDTDTAVASTGAGVAVTGSDAGLPSGTS